MREVIDAAALAALRAEAGRLDERAAARAAEALRAIPVDELEREARDVAKDRIEAVEQGAKAREAVARGRLGRAPLDPEIGREARTAVELAEVARAERREPERTEAGRDRQRRRAARLGDEQLRPAEGEPDGLERRGARDEAGDEARALGGGGRMRAQTFSMQ